MPVCPECKATINELMEIMVDTIVIPVWLDDNGFWHSGIREIRDSELMDYECPECKEILF